MRRVVWLLALFAAGQSDAQHIGFGIKGGAPVSGDVVSYFAQSESKRYVIGPMLDLALPRRFGVEMDALYRRTGFRTGDGGFWGAYQNSYRANTWEFPMMLKYRLPLRVARPYAEVGYVPRHIGGRYTGAGYMVDIPTGALKPYTSQGAWNPDMSHGVAAGGGLELGRRHVRIATGSRYTRWNNDPINFYGSQGYSVNAALNQVDVLVGVAWSR